MILLGFAELTAVCVSDSPGNPMPMDVMNCIVLPVRAREVGHSLNLHELELGWHCQYADQYGKAMAWLKWIMQAQFSSGKKRKLMVVL